MSEIKSKASVITGIDESKIVSVGAQLDLLRRQGILIDLTVTGTSMFTRTANFAELGIQDEAKLRRYSPGTKYLIPKDQVNKLKSVEARMRQALDQFTVDIKGFKPYRWLSYKAWPKWVDRWAELAAEFYSVKEDILDSYTGYTDLLISEFADGAGQTWDSAIAQGYDAIIWGKKAYLDRDEFVDAVVELALSRLPTEDDINTNLQADYLVGVVYGAQDYAQDQAKAAEVKQKASQAAEAEYLENAAMQEELRHTMKMNQLAEDERQAQINAMFEAELEHAKQQIQELGSPLAEVVAALRNQVANDAESMLQSIKRNGFVRGKIAQKGAGLLEFYDLMATHNDRDLRNKLEMLKFQIGPIGNRSKDEPERDVDAIRATLEEIATLATDNLKDITEISRAAFLEL